MEKHGRPGLEDPWSVRQTAVYQRINVDEQSSIWLFVQVAKPIRNAIDAVMSGENGRNTVTGTARLHPSALHVYIITSNQHNWKDYVRYLDQIVNDFVSSTIWLFLQGKIERADV